MLNVNIKFYPEGEILCQDVSPTPAVPVEPTKASVPPPSPGVTQSPAPVPAPALPASSSDPSVLTGDPAVDPTGSDVVDEISKLLASDKVLEEDAGNEEEDNQELESIGLLEPDRVKHEEAALDDKLTVELRSIVDQIQVYCLNSQHSHSVLNSLREFH